MSHGKSYFSIRNDLVVADQALVFDLYVNSSAVKEKDHFVRIFPKGEKLTAEDLHEFVHKYHQLYIPEDQRDAYMKALTQSSQIDDVGKATVIKDCALEYLHRIFDKDKEFSTEILSQGIENCREAVEGMVDVLDNYGIDDLRGLIGNLSFHDFYTYDHSINVSMYCITIYRVLFPDAPRIEVVHAGLGGLLHDLGKIKIPTEILNNGGDLTDEQYKLIKKHPDFGLELLLQGHVQVHAEIDLEVISRVVHEHHENWAGHGYPKNLRGDQIHLMARVCSVADFFDAITTKRSYNEVLNINEALNVMRKFRGTKLDPVIFDIFEKHVHLLEASSSRNLRMMDHFDPTLPYERLPLVDLGPAEEETEKDHVVKITKGKKIR